MQPVQPNDKLTYAKIQMIQMLQMLHPDLQESSNGMIHLCNMGWIMQMQTWVHRNIPIFDSIEQNYNWIISNIETTNRGS